MEADLTLPEMSQPLRLPLQLLPIWIEPCVGTDFLGRYEVKKVLEDRPGAKGQVFEVYDKEAKKPCGLQVCDLMREGDVKCFVERLQLESLDTDNKLFMRLHDVALALPGRLAIIEDIPTKNLWEDFDRIEPGTNLVAKVAAVANAILGGLCRLHAHGWAHCGVSPLTVCLSMDGDWKLTSLEGAKRVRELAAVTPALTGTAFAPEALLGLPVTEKVDVWQLAATLCEAIMRKRICEGVDAASVGIPEQMVSLVNFLGPLPEGLVAQHPNREELFTPEGYVLRPTTPGAGEQALEALEPSVPAVPARTGSDCIPRPHLVAEALSGVDGANDILEFLGRLLNPDPEQRPSATEAMAHHFLRFAHTKGAANEDKKRMHFEEGAAAESEAKPVDGGVKMARKGTGFVHMGELPPSDDEDEDEDDEEEEEEQPQRGSKQQGGKHVRVEAKEEPKEDKKGAAPMSRNGTGFVHVGELPPSDDEDEDEEEEAKPAAKHVTVEADGPEKGEKKDGGPLARKGTAFVQMGELPPSDSEEEEEEEDEDTPKAPKAVAGDARQVVVEDTGSRGVPKTKEGGNMARKGTGFVHMGELPGSDDEDEDEEEEEAPEKAKRVHLSGEAELAAKKEAEKVPAGDGSKMARKGTGFVHMGELPPSDDEDEEEEEEPAEPVKKVQISEKDKDAARHGQGDDDGQSGGRMSRKGTGFVSMGELPPSDSEDEEEDEERPSAASSKKVKIAADEGEAKPEGESKMARKGTGFVNHGDLPDDSEDEGEEEEEEEKAPVKKAVDFDPSAQQEENKNTSARPARKGTGFVNVADIPDSDDEDEDEAPAIGAKKTVGFDAEPEQEKAKPAADGVVGKVARKGTGFVHMSEIVDSDDDEED